MVDITSSVVKNLKHWYKSIAVAICPSDVAVTGSNTVDCKANPPCVFRNYGTLLKSVINAIYAVLTHCEQEA